MGDEPDFSKKAPSFGYDFGIHYNQDSDFLDNTSPVNSRIPLNEKIFQEIKPSRVSEPFYKPPQNQKP